MMPIALGRIGRGLASLAESLRDRKEGEGNAPKSPPQEATLNAQTSLESSAKPDRAPAAPVPEESILKFTPAKWIENDSIADTESTITRSRVQNMRQPDILSSIHAEGDPSITRGSSVRANMNDAAQPLRSLLPSRDGSSFYYTRNGRPGPSKPSKPLYGQHHPYCCPNPEDLRRLYDNFFEPEDDTHPDWRLNANQRCKAGHRDNVEDFSEWHLAERLFYNASIFTPAEHLEGSQKAALQDLRAMYLENLALRASASDLVANADRLEREVKVLQQRLGRIDAEIDEMTSLLNQNGREPTFA